LFLICNAQGVILPIISPKQKDKMPPLNNRQRLAYGAGELGPAMAGSTLVFFQLKFLTDVAGMNPGLAGSVLLIARIWDAINDPLIGWFSDHTKSRFGRRLPWMMAGAVPFAGFFCLFWLGPEIVGSSSQLSLFVFYSLVAILYSTVTTAYALPHSALTAELSHDYDERSRLTASRMGFSLGGSVGGLILALGVFWLLPDAPPLVQYGMLGLSVAVLGLAAAAFCVWGIWTIAIQAEKWRKAHPVSTKTVEPPLLRQLGAVLQNRPFLLVCGIYLCSWLAMQFTAGVLPFYTGTVMELPASMFPVLALAVQATALLLLPLWARISLWRGKKEVFYYGMSFWLVAQAGLLFLAPGQLPMLFVLAVLAGVGISVCYLIPNAMLPDVIEWDELRTGMRREGIYYGFCVFLQKVALALGIFFVGQILAWSGYQASGPEDLEVVQPESAVRAIRWAIGPLPALILVAGLVVAAFYPISRPVHARMVRILEIRARRQKKNAGVD
jgi:GPH family glycoside/pentoside/hexuronide:cation symporter